jgi:hypothetical protein
MLGTLTERYADLIITRALIRSELLISDTLTYLIAGTPVMILLLILVGVFIKLLIKDPKGSLVALFGVLGVIAVLVIPGVLWDEEKWASVIQLVILGSIVIYELKCHPKRLLKIVVITIACTAGLVLIAITFGLVAALAVAFNGVFLLITLSAVKGLKESLRMEREGICTEGRFVRWDVCGRNAHAIFAYTTEDGRHYEEAVCDFVTASQKMKKQTLMLLYDKDDPTRVFVKKYSLMSNIIDLCIFLAILAGSLGLSIYMLIQFR